MGQGVMADGSLAQVFRSVGGETWSIVITRPNGLACLVLNGSDWEAIPWHLPEPKTNGARFVPAVGHSMSFRWLESSQGVGDRAIPWVWCEMREAHEAHWDIADEGRYAEASARLQELAAAGSCLNNRFFGIPVVLIEFVDRIVMPSGRVVEAWLAAQGPDPDKQVYAVFFRRPSEESGT